MKQTPRKLALDTDALQVESFALQEAPTEQPGTVRAHLDEPTAPRTCGCPTQNTHCGQYTCYASCYCPSWSGPECGTVCVG